MNRTPPPGDIDRRAGRRPGKSNTRNLLLEAARELFAERGYDGASLRDISAAAGVDPGMIRHYFGDKETLFVTAMTEQTNIPERLASAFEGPPEQLGARAADTYLRLWEDETTRQILTGLVRSAMTSPRGAELLAEVLTGRAAKHAPPQENNEARARGLLLAASHLFGTAVARSVFQVPPLATMSHDELVEEIAPAIQRYLEGS